MSNNDESATLLVEVYDELKHTITTQSITAGDMAGLTVNLMRIVQNLDVTPPLTGPEKKQLVLNVLNRLVEDTTLVQEEHKPTIQIFIDLVLPTLIDKIKDVAHGKSDLGAADGCKCVVL